MSRIRKNKSNNVKQGMGVLPFVVIAFFLMLCLVGIALDEPARVVKQATQICPSCIGIG